MCVRTYIIQTSNEKQIFNSKFQDLNLILPKLNRANLDAYITIMIYHL